MSDNLYTISYNNQHFQVDPILFSHESETFRQYYNPTQIMSIDCEIPNNFFEEFIRGVEGKKDFKITKENYENMRQLAQQWGVNKIKKLIDDFFVVLHLDNTLTEFLQSLKTDNPRKDLIPVLAENLDNLLTKEQFLRVPPTFLNQILKNESCKIINHQEFYRFIKGFIHFNKMSEYLLNYLDPTKMSDNEINELLELKYFDLTKPNHKLNVHILLFKLCKLFHDRYKEEHKKLEDSQEKEENNRKALNYLAQESKELDSKLNYLQRKYQNRKHFESNQWGGGNLNQKRDKIRKKQYEKKSSHYDKFTYRPGNKSEKKKENQFYYSPSKDSDETKNNPPMNIEPSSIQQRDSSQETCSDDEQK